jgi:hypothetical protein
MVHDSDSAASRRPSNRETSDNTGPSTRQPEAPQWTQQYSLSSPEVRSFYLTGRPMGTGPQDTGVRESSNGMPANDGAADQRRLRSMYSSGSSSGSSDSSTQAAARFDRFLATQGLNAPREQTNRPDLAMRGTQDFNPGTNPYLPGAIGMRRGDHDVRQHPQAEVPLRPHRDQQPQASKETMMEGSDNRSYRMLSNGRAIPLTQTGDTMSINLNGMRNLDRVIAQKPNWAEFDLNELSKYNHVDHKTGQTTNSVVDKLHAAGIKVIAYMNAGASQPEYDFPDIAKGHVMSGYPNEHYLDVRKIGQPGDTVGPVLGGFMKRAAAMKVDAVDPDNVDSWDNSTGFGLNYQHGLAFNKWLAHTAHENGLGIMLKNNGKQAKDLEPYFDGAVTEEALRPRNDDPRADSYRVFTAPRPDGTAGKAVFELQYKDSTAAINQRAKQYGYSLISENKALDGSRH